MQAPPVAAPEASDAVEPATAEDAVMTTMTGLGRRLRQRLDGEEIDFSTLRVLQMLAQQGAQRVSALAARLELDASTVSRHVTALERRGLLDRGVDPDDGRAHRVALSRRGRRCLEQGASRRRAMIARALDGWSLEDREQLRMLLTRLHLDLQAHP